MINMAVPSNGNTTVKVAEKLSKHKVMETEITKMCGMKQARNLEVIPVGKNLPVQALWRGKSLILLCKSPG